MISFCTASRKRPQIYKDMCESILGTADNPGDIEFVVYRDGNDDSEYEYLNNIKEIRGPRIGASNGTNECQKIATGPIYGYVPDDTIFLTQGWDTEVKKSFEKYADKIALVYMDDRKWGRVMASIGFLHKNWIDTLGYFMPPARADKWIYTVAKKLDRRIYLIHLKYKNLEILDDEVHQEYYQTPVTPRYSHLTQKRLDDVNKLKEFICNFQS